MTDTTEFTPRPLHGQLIDCPACGTPGHFDNTTSGTVAFPDWIWIAPDGEFECYECSLK